MLVNQRTPADRLRLTIVHELGDLCLPSLEITPTMEDETNSFAAEFLMPTEAIRAQLRNLTRSPARLEARMGCLDASAHRDGALDRIPQPPTANEHVQAVLGPRLAHPQAGL
jgi:Zn-dependent peptidase ImmA (M78 family)